MDILGYIAAILIGFTMGLLGGGGSILTIPVLVYLLGVDPLLATSYSLFVVGTCSLVGSFHAVKKKNVDFTAFLYFGIPSLIAVYFIRTYLLPIIPENIFRIGNVVINRGTLLMLLFAILMIASAFSMVFKKQIPNPENSNTKRGLLIIQGLLVGSVTGILGAGGGFMIVPSLVLISKLSMKKAVGTSLTLMTCSALFGFFISIDNNPIEFKSLFLFTGIALIGIFFGGGILEKIESNKLKKIFGYFVFVMGLFIITKELIELL